ncbi:hypothetical protein VOI32_15590 [Paraburkholderia caribensis]|uniref:Phage tail protein n=2 Tax=Paraburkholderia caribensis TaxID=75105 RepID=A0ABV0DXZ5_9BURK|nr:hypothetical protein [Paraburkholderia caribensis]MCO4875785.1 hypothetical protein [Paraburkholderia caribensis]
MSTGDQRDMLGRMQALLPSGWFGDAPPVLTALLNGFAAILANVYTVLMYAKAQLRIATATDGVLDLISADFFGPNLPRKTSESDTAFRNRITINLFRERATRKAVVDVLTMLTGRAPLIIEPSRPDDTGGYGIACGYGVAGAYGSLLLPYQAFITAYRPIGTGIPYVAGYGSSPSGYSIASRGEYASLSMVQESVSDADIYSAIDSVMPAGTIAWTRING